MKFISIIILTIITLIGISCSYSVRMNQYPHLRNVVVYPFDNKTVEIHLAESLREDLITYFQQDGRLRITYDDADSIVEGEISDYKNEVYGFDMDQNIEEYRVTITFEISFTDLVRNDVIWENSSFSLSERYYPMSEDHESVRLKTEEEAQKAIFEELFKVIIRNSLEAW